MRTGKLHKTSFEIEESQGKSQSILSSIEHDNCSTPFDVSVLEEGEVLTTYLVTVTVKEIQPINQD